MGPGFDGPDNNLAFRFTALNLKETTAKAQINKLALSGTPWKTVNEARIEDGREPLKGEVYDDLIMTTPQGAVALSELMTAKEMMQQSNNQNQNNQSQGRASGAPSPKGDASQSDSPTASNGKGNSK